LEDRDQRSEKITEKITTFSSRSQILTDFSRYKREESFAFSDVFAEKAKILFILSILSMSSLRPLRLCGDFLFVCVRPRLNIYRPCFRRYMAASALRKI
jgi:hypothetical protein